MGWMGVRGPWSLLPPDGKLPTEVLERERERAGREVSE